MTAGNHTMVDILILVGADIERISTFVLACHNRLCSFLPHLSPPPPPPQKKKKEKRKHTSANLTNIGTLDSGALHLTKYAHDGPKFDGDIIGIPVILSWRAFKFYTIRLIECVARYQWLFFPIFVFLMIVFLSF